MEKNPPDRPHLSFKDSEVWRSEKFDDPDNISLKPWPIAFVIFGLGTLAAFVYAIFYNL
jgi:hypothetical protein